MPFLHKLARRLAISGTLAAIGVGLACTSTAGPGDHVARVVVQPHQASLRPGQQHQFVAYGQTLAGDQVAVDVTWHATGGQVSADGMFRADSTSGDYMVTATAVQSQSVRQFLADTSYVQVGELQLDSLVISPKNPTIRMGSSLELTATGYTSGDTTTVSVTWTSSDGTVTSNGKGKGHYNPGGPGKHRIGAGGGGQTDTTTVTVTPDSVVTVSVSPASATLYVGSTQAFTATLKDSAGTLLTGLTVTWSSSNAAVATVDASGLVTARGLGSAAISATSEGKSGTAAVSASLAPVASVAITPASASVLVGQTAQLAAVVEDSAGNTLAGRTVTWASSNTAVGTVNGTGLVTAVAGGSATITATSEGHAATATVTTSLVPVASVTVAPASAALQVGQTRQLAATAKDSAGNVLAGRVITWTSGNASVATVSATGLVTAIGAGSATVTATSEGHSGAASLSVTLAPVASVTITPSSTGLLVGQTAQLTATLKDSAGNLLTGRTVAWSTSNAAVASVSGTGLVTAATAGSATITATSEGKSGSAAVAVSVVPVASVTVAPSSAALLTGQAAQLTATPRDSAGNALTGRTATWSTSNSAVATVSGSGLVTAVGAGSATVMAASEGHSGTAAVTVSLVPVASVTVTPASSTIQMGQTAQLAATLKDSAGNALAGRAVTWTSSDATVASVNGTGLVSAVQAGSVTITAASEGKSGSGTVTVTSVAPPPPGPDEPVYTAGQDTSYMYDDFEVFSSSTDLLTYQSHYPGRWIKNSATNTTNTQLTTTGAFEGSHGVRFIYSGSGGAQQDRLIESDNTGVPNSANVVLATFYLRSQPGYAWNNATGNTHKIFNMNVGGATTRILLCMGEEPLTPAMPAYGTLSDERPSLSISNNNYNQNLNYDKVRTRAGGSQVAMNDGNWHRYTIRITRSTSRPTSETGNGRLEMWVDGIKVMEYLGDVSSRPEYGLVNVPTAADGSLIPSVHFPSVRNADTGGSDIWIEYDAVRFWADRP